ncbi:unnamed protein product [Mytilus coruscus]|uniref:Uncharacterized protein n=1 Tax=Mytilus coruscus TaxID=42192 RepID=A0A6J8BYC5_MYTCO|nr:unnamed protein product [Mytilus coruscus]
MSENKILKSCRTFYINPKEVNKKKATRKAVILADSKGKYIEREITTEHCLNIKFIVKSGWTVQKCIDWVEKNLTTTFHANETYTFYIWLGTCDITNLDRSTRLISLDSDSNRNIRYIIRKFQELKEAITSRIIRSDIVFLEVPSISIQHWNYKKGHIEYQDYQEQDTHLEYQLDELNLEIRRLNGSENRSPKFMQDLWRGSKGHNPKGKTTTYTNLSLLEDDGVHPKKILARLWLRRIATKALQDCFSQLPPKKRKKNKSKKNQRRQNKAGPVT